MQVQGRRPNQAAGVEPGCIERDLSCTWNERAANPTCKYPSVPGRAGHLSRTLWSRNRKQVVGLEEEAGGRGGQRWVASLVRVRELFPFKTSLSLWCVYIINFSCFHLQSSHSYNLEILRSNLHMIKVSTFKSMHFLRAEIMAQWLGALLARWENLSWVPSKSMVSQNCP